MLNDSADLTRSTNMEHVEVLRDLSEVCRAAIKAGDWKVDGACDPDSLLRHADAVIASLSAPKPPPMNDKCPKCGDELDYDKFSDSVCIGSFYFDVHITACPGCGHVHDGRTWVE